VNKCSVKKGLPVLLQLVIIEDAFVCYQTRKSVLYLLCVISAIVQINFQVKSGESTLLLSRCLVKRVTILCRFYFMCFIILYFNERSELNARRSVSEVTDHGLMGHGFFPPPPRAARL
jgi:hypothetical protein